jgi:hypothetical protein
MLAAVIAVVAVSVGVALFLWHTSRHHPEQTASHHPASEPMQAGPDPVGEQRYPGTDRPGGPGAEGENVPEPGAISPGIPGAPAPPGPRA